MACLHCQAVYCVTQINRAGRGHFICSACGNHVLEWSASYDSVGWTLWEAPQDHLTVLQEDLALAEALLAKAKSELPKGEERKVVLRQLGNVRLDLLAQIEVELQKE